MTDVRSGGTCGDDRTTSGWSTFSSGVRECREVVREGGQLARNQDGTRTCEVQASRIAFGTVATMEDGASGI